MLPAHHDGTTPEREGWNLMSDAARAYTRARVAAVRAAHGTIGDDRLWRNLLSSQPLAFSIAGELRARPADAVDVLGDLGGLTPVGFGALGDADDVYRLDGLQAEWAPAPAEALGDRSAADLAAALVLADGRSCLITVEVKYTEPFSPGPIAGDPRYAGALTALGLTDDDAVALAPSGGTQFLRSVLLTDAVRRRHGIDEVLAVVLGRSDDATARDVVARVGQAVPDVPTAYWSHEDFLTVCGARPALTEWADRMHRRYVGTL